MHYFKHLCVVGLIVLSASKAFSVITVMPLGDSITAGYDGNPNGTTFPGYRDDLLASTASEGISIQYVGANTGGECPELAAIGQNDSNGYSGYDSLSILQNLDGNVQPSYSTTSNYGGYWLTGGNGTGRTAQYPNFVLFFIGTNDFPNGIPLGNASTPDTTEGDIAATLSWFTTNRPNTVVVVGTPLRNANSSINAIGAAEANWLPGYIAANDPQDEFVNLYNDVPFADISSDGTHPTDTGYAIISNDFNAAIEAVTPVPEPSSMLAGLAVAVMLHRKR